MCHFGRFWQSERVVVMCWRYPGWPIDVARCIAVTRYLFTYLHACAMVVHWVFARSIHHRIPNVYG
jgi:hypothetical protein